MNKLIAIAVGAVLLASGGGSVNDPRYHILGWWLVLAGITSICAVSSSWTRVIARVTAIALNVGVFAGAAVVLGLALFSPGSRGGSPEICAVFAGMGP